MTEITITVSGAVGSGKSAILGEIEILMKALRVPVRYADEGAAISEKGMTHADWQSALEMYEPSVVLIEDMPWLRPPAEQSVSALAKIDAWNLKVGQWVVTSDNGRACFKGWDSCMGQKTLIMERTDGSRWYPLPDTLQADIDAAIAGEGK